MTWRHELLRPALSVAIALAPLVTGCGAPEGVEPPEAALLILERFDPDITDPQQPIPGSILWWSTRAGVARFLADDGRELTIDRVAASGGELMVTSVEPRVLLPGLTSVEIYYVLQQTGGVVLRETVTFFLDAECTLHDHCPLGACTDFQCQ